MCLGLLIEYGNDANFAECFEDEMRALIEGQTELLLLTYVAIFTSFALKAGVSHYTDDS